MTKPHIQVMAAMAAGLAGLYGAASTANADGYQRRPVAAAPCCGFSWTGFYVGVNGGYAWGDDQTVHVNETLESPVAPPFLFASANFGSLALIGGFAGIQAGANLQMGAVVLGFEVDGQWADIGDDSFATVAVPVPGSSPYTVGTSNKVTRFGTFRPRLGLAWDKTLVYATGGLAWGRIEHTMNYVDSSAPIRFTAVDHVTGTHVGYVVGGGVEHAFGPHMSLKLEYQYIDLGSETYKAREDRAGATNFYIATDTATTFHTVRLGLNIKLGAREAPLLK